MRRDVMCQDVMREGRPRGVMRRDVMCQDVMREARPRGGMRRDVMREARPRGVMLEARPRGVMRQGLIYPGLYRAVLLCLLLTCCRPAGDRDHAALPPGVVAAVSLTAEQAGALREGRPLELPQPSALISRSEPEPGPAAPTGEDGLAGQASQVVAGPGAAPGPTGPAPDGAEGGIAPGDRPIAALTIPIASPPGTSPTAKPAAKARTARLPSQPAANAIQDRTALTTAPGSRCRPPLTEAAIDSYWHVAPTAPTFVEARRCLAAHFRARHERSGERRALEELVRQGSSRYDPTVLLELSVLELNEGRPDDSLKWVRDAERFQQRWALADTYSRLVLLQEVKGKAYQQRFNQAGDPLDLERATQAWRSCRSLAVERRDPQIERRANERLHALELIREMAEPGRKP